MGLRGTAVIFQRTQDLRGRNTGHDIGRPGSEAADTRIAICPEQVEVVGGDGAANVFNLRRYGRLVARDQAIVESKCCG